MGKKAIAIAIDGPAAAGKSTVAKEVAKRLGFVYIDTGAMYRAFTYYVLKKGLDPQNHEESISLIPEISISFGPNNTVFCNGIDVTREIREPNVSGNVSYIAAYPEIREALVKQQREMAKSISVVMDGRDIGTNVLVDAEVKIFQIASVETRAKRRYDENVSKGIKTSYEDVVNDVKKRDYIDSHRDCAPLKEAKDAVRLDTSDLTIEESIQAILAIIKDKTGIEA